MKNYLINFILASINVFCMYVLYNTFISFRYQLIMREDSKNKTFSLSKEQVESIPSFPNIGVTTLPITSIASKYYMYNGEFSKGIALLDEGTRINPHIHYSDYLLGLYYLDLKQIDSAYKHAKKALYGWPKNIDHYNLFNKVLEVKKDTTAILDTYDYINTVFETKEQHQQMFIDAYSNAKLRYLIFNYPDEKSVNKDTLQGKWQQMYEFETGKINYLKNTINFKNNIFTTVDGVRYKYKIENDTLKLFFIKSNKQISSMPIYYSDSLNTLILKNIARSVIDDNPEIQDQFFKKIED